MLGGTVTSGVLKGTSGRGTNGGPAGLGLRA